MSASVLSCVFAALGGRYVCSDAEHYDTRPTLAVAKDGTLWTAWIGWSEKDGARVFARRADVAAANRANGVDGVDRAAISFAASDPLHPALAIGSDGEPWLVDAERTNGELAILARVAADSKRPPERIDAEKSAARNPCAVGLPDGSLEIAWESLRDGVRGIFARRVHAAQPEAPTAIAAHGGACSDATLALDAHGEPWIAWSEWDGARYRLYVRRLGRAPLGPLEIAADLEGYALHPSLAGSADGRMWIAFDQVVVPGHGSSYRTTETRVAETRAAESSSRAHAAVRVRATDGAKLFEFRGENSAQGVVPASPVFGHGARPKLAIDARGDVWLAWRTIRLLRTNRGVAHDVMVERFGGERELPRVLVDADGPFEDVAIAADAQGSVFVAYQTDHREQAFAWLDANDPRAASWKVDREFLSPLGWSADVEVVALDSRPAEAARANLPLFEVARAQHADLVRNPAERASTELGGARYSLFFGDLHRHSCISRCSAGGEPDPEQDYAYAMDVMRDDFFELTDHVEHTNDATWWMLQEFADAWNEPGRFVTFFGYEWTNAHGHKNVVAPARDTPRFAHFDSAKTDPNALWKFLDGRRALTIPHHTADPDRATEFEFDDARFQRLIEVFQSGRGSYESANAPRIDPHPTLAGRFVADALRRGLKFGLTASSDHGYGTAYTAVWAESFTRDAIFDALAARRCYATTARDLVLDVRSGARAMGSEFATRDAPSFQAEVECPRKLVLLEWLRDGEPLAKEVPGDAHRAHWEWTDRDAPRGPHAYYLRTTDAEGELGWTSPFFIDCQP